MEEGKKKEEHKLVEIMRVSDW